MKIIAVDFDGTLFERDRYPAFGKPRWGIINALKKELENTSTHAVLWTCREGDDLQAAVAACKAVGLEFDAVNDNHPSTREWMRNENPRKVFADEYWDDRNRDLGKILLSEAVPVATLL